MEAETKVVQIQGNRYDSGLLKYTKDFPQLYKEYIRRKRFGISCKYILELTSNIYWHYVNSMYFPLDWFPAVVDFDLVGAKIDQKIRTLASWSSKLDLPFIQTEIKSQEVYEAVRFWCSDIEENLKIAAPGNHKPAVSHITGIDLATDDSEQSKSIHNSVMLNHAENNSSKFSDIVFKQSSDSLNNSYSDIEEGFLNCEECKISDVISYLEMKLKDKQDSIRKTFDQLKTEIKVQQRTIDNNSADEPVLESKIGQDLKLNYNYYIKHQNPFLLCSYLPYSRDDEEIKLTTNQNIFFERKKLAFQKTNQPMCKAFDLNLSFSDLKALEPDFVNIDDACLVWSKGDYTKDNLIIYCDKCNWMVHQKCYDLKVIPDGKWFWYKCEVFDKDHLNLIKCTMCQQYGGIMKPSAYFAKSSIYESVQKDRRNSFGGKQENLTVPQILQIEKEHYVTAKKNIEIYGKFQTYFHWAHIGWWYWKEEFREIQHDVPINFSVFNLEDFNKLWQLWSSKDGITHKCQSWDYTFHYECGRRRNCFFSKTNKLKTRTIRCLCFNHRPNNRIKEIEKNKQRKILEIAETWVSLKYYSELNSQIQSLEASWTQKCSKKLKSWIYKQIKDCCPVNVIISKCKDNSHRYKSGIESIFNRLMKGGVLDWNRINIRSYNIDFLKHMFYKEWNNPKAFRDFIVKYSVNYSRRHVKKVVKATDQLTLTKAPFFVTQDKEKWIKRQKTEEFEWDPNLLPILPESECLIGDQYFVEKNNNFEINKIAEIEIPKHSAPIKSPNNPIYNQQREDLIQALEEEEIGITNGNLFSESSWDQTFCTCQTTTFKGSYSRILTWK